jgi:hypothetical protein
VATAKPNDSNTLIFASVPDRTTLILVDEAD